MTTLTISQVFGRINEEGAIDLFDMNDERATRLDANVYPVGSSTSARYEHADGLTITADDAKLLGIEIE